MRMSASFSKSNKLKIFEIGSKLEGSTTSPAHLTRNGFTETVCVLTSAKVYKSPQWTDISLAKAYQVTFELINDNIVSVFPKGTAEPKDVTLLP